VPTMRNLHIEINESQSQNCSALKTTKKWTIGVLLCIALMVGCGGGGGNTTTPPPQVTVSVAGVSAPINTGTSHTFTASVKNSSNQGVTWSVVEAGGGALNHPQFADPDANFTSPTFGVISGTAVNARVGQLAMKFMF
jgi:hypothetical protein